MAVALASAATRACARDGWDTATAVEEDIRWGFGETEYFLPLSSDKLGGDMSLAREYALSVYQCGVQVAALCSVAPHSGGPSPDTSECRQSLRAAAFVARTVLHSIRQTFGKRAVERAADSSPGLLDGDEILDYHAGVLFGMINRTRKVLVPRSPVEAAAAWAFLADAVVRRMEVLRWHITYHLFIRVFARTSLLLPPIVFHEFCCSSGEVLGQLVEAWDLFKERPLGGTGWSARFVEIGVETGRTSRELLKLLPQHVQLVGVDPYRYDEGLDLNGAERWQREEMSFRYDTSWLENLAAGVEELYNTTPGPPGRARLLRKTSLDAADDPMFAGDAAGVSTDMVFVDGDHAEVAVQRDIAAWLRVLKASRGWGPVGGGRQRILAGHDFTFMFPGVITAVFDLAEELAAETAEARQACEMVAGDEGAIKGHGCGGHLVGAGASNFAGNGSSAASVHVAANAVWWVSVPAARSI